MVKQWYPTKKLGKCLVVVNFGLWGVEFHSILCFSPCHQLVGASLSNLYNLVDCRDSWDPKKSAFAKWFGPLGKSKQCK